MNEILSNLDSNAHQVSQASNSPEKNMLKSVNIKVDNHKFIQKSIGPTTLSKLTRNHFSDDGDNAAAVEGATEPWRLSRGGNRLEMMARWGDGGRRSGESGVAGGSGGGCGHVDDDVVVRMTVAEPQWC
ncbi:hypothetical protein Tco_0647110 [Tanacetum coccineum]